MSDPTPTPLDGCLVGRGVAGAQATVHVLACPSGAMQGWGGRMSTIHPTHRAAAHLPIRPPCHRHWRRFNRSCNNWKQCNMSLPGGRVCARWAQTNTKNGPASSTAEWWPAVAVSRPEEHSGEPCPALNAHKMPWGTHRLTLPLLRLPLTPSPPSSLSLVHPPLPHPSPSLRRALRADTAGSHGRRQAHRVQRLGRGVAAVDRRP